MRAIHVDEVGRLEGRGGACVLERVFGLAERLQGDDAVVLEGPLAHRIEAGFGLALHYLATGLLVFVPGEGGREAEGLLNLVFLVGLQEQGNV